MSQSIPMALFILNHVNSALASHNRGSTMQQILASNTAGNNAHVLSPIEGEMNRIENRISQIGDAIMQLRGSLATVLRDESPAKAESTTVPREIEQSTMHAHLREYADRLENINRSVLEITSRVTL